MVYHNLGIKQIKTIKQNQMVPKSNAQCPCKTSNHGALIFQSQIIIQSLRFSDVLFLRIMPQICLQRYHIQLLFIILIRFVLNYMDFSIISAHLDQLHQDLDTIHWERLHSLELQISSLQSLEPHIDVLKDILNEHKNCKIIRSKSLLDQQYRLVNRQEKENELQRYHSRIKQLQQLIKIKEEEMWEQSLNGRRVKNIALHRQSLNLFHHEEKQSSTIFSELAKRNQLEKQIAKLTTQAKIKEQNQGTGDYFMGGLDTILLKMIRDEEEIKNDLEELQQSLQSELLEQKAKQRQLINKYQKFASHNTGGQVKQNAQSEKKDSSSKTISTQGDQGQL